MDWICNGYEFDMYLIQFLDLEKKQKIHRAAAFGTTEYVIDMNLISNVYEFDMYWV